MMENTMPVMDMNVEGNKGVISKKSVIDTNLYPLFFNVF